MCGRFTLATPPEILAALFALDDLGDWNDPRFNIAPQTRVLTVRAKGGERVGQTLLWGAPNPRDSRPLINARSETVAASPLFAPSFAGARILIPADGFFEWTGAAGRRQGHYFQQPGGGPFAFAGIAVNRPAAPAEEEPAAVILTTGASKSVRAFHDRMPLVVGGADFAEWLDPAASPAATGSILSTGALMEWDSHPVGPMVNSVRNDSPENIRPVEPGAERQGSLFQRNPGRGAPRHRMNGGG